jgi:hypothetical protein
MRYWLPAAILGFLAGLAVASVPLLIHFQSGGGKMESPTLSEMLKRVDKTQPGSMDAFAARLLDKVREDPRGIVATAVSKDHDSALRARETLLRLEDTIIWPASHAGAGVDVADRLWLAGSAVRAEVQLRRDLAVTLEKLIADTTLLPDDRPAGIAEGSSPPTRVCDQAYLLLRELIHATEGGYNGMLNRDRFLANPFDDRDVELKKFIKHRQFTNFMDEPGPEE